MTTAERKFRGVVSAFREFMQQHSAILSQLSPLLAASSPARSTLVLLRQLQLAGDSAAHAIQTVALDHQVYDSGGQEQHAPVLNQPALWGRLERSMQPPQSAAPQASAARPPLPINSSRISVSGSLRGRVPSTSGSVARRRGRSAAASTARPAKAQRQTTPTRPKQQHKAVTDEHTTRHTKQHGSCGAHDRGPAPTDRLLQMMALTAQRAQEDAATANAALQGTQRELEFAKAAARSAPSSGALLAAAQAADRLFEQSQGCRGCPPHTAAYTKSDAPDAYDGWHNRHSDSSVPHQAAWVDSPPSSIHMQSESDSTGSTMISSVLNSTGNKPIFPKEESHAQMSAFADVDQLQLAGGSSQPAVAPEQPKATTPAQSKPTRKRGPAAQPPLGNNAPPDLRADDDDMMPVPGRPRPSASGLIAHALSEARGVDSYVSSARGSPTAQGSGATLDDEISALEKSLVALGMSGSSGSGDTTRASGHEA